VTLRHLAQHYSGFSTLPPGAYPDIKAYTAKKLQEYVKSAILSNAPGVQFIYSTTGYTLLGNYLGQCHEETWEKALIKRVITPLGLTHTGLVPAANSKIVPGFTLEGTSYKHPRPSGVFAPSGGLYSCVSDLLIFLKSNIAPPNKMWSKVFALVHNPALARPSFPGSKILLGWHLFTPMKILWHSGTSGGYKTFMAFSQKAKVGVVLVANRALAPSNPRLEMTGFMLLAKLQTPL